MTEYVRWLRRHIGHAKTPLVYASTIVTDDRGAILFQRRADFGDAWWGLPGGLMELGESIAQTAVRETREETGLRVEPARLVGLYTSPDFDVTYPNGDQVQQVTACFASRTLGGRLHPQNDEILELRFCLPGALPPMPHWYAAMVDDFLADRPEASFWGGSPGVSADESNSTYMAIRRAIGGHESIIIVGASAFIRAGDGVVLQRRADNGMWVVPGGAIELGERIDRAAVREAREETGLQVEPTRLVSIYSEPRWKATYPHGDQVQLFVAMFDCRVIGGALESDGVESAEVRCFPLSELPADLPDRTRVRIEDALASRREAIVR